MLIDELNHRVKNTLSTVQAITRQALRSSADPKVVKELIESRIFALSRSHDLLTHQNWEGAGLRDLIGAALAPFRDGRAERFTIEGPEIRLRPKETLALGIAFHELATNAVKYGAFSNDVGTIRIAWDVRTQPDGERLTLTWREKGGPLVMPPEHKGFGSQVIERGLAHELQGEVRLEYLPGGVVCTMDLPVPRRIADE
jgi:two-component sensor histidine kinase